MCYRVRGFLGRVPIRKQESSPVRKEGIEYYELYSENMGYNDKELKMNIRRNNGTSTIRSMKGEEEKRVVNKLWEAIHIVVGLGPAC
jgi:hypothetical protein